MGFLNSLFGDMASNVWSVGAALAIVIVLIVFLVWLLKFVLNASRTVARGRNRRIGVTESVMVDTKRQLVLIRRDDVEHLVLTGGPQDLVIEGDIPLMPEPVAVPPRRTAPGRTAETRRGAERPAAPLRPSFAAASPLPTAANEGQPAPSGRVAGLTPRPEDENGDARLSPMEKLRQFAERPAAKGAAALRYPGLLRPITRHRAVSENPNKADAAADDSDMSAAQPSEMGESGSGDTEKASTAKAKRAGGKSKSRS